MTYEAKRKAITALLCAGLAFLPLPVQAQEAKHMACQPASLVEPRMTQELFLFRVGAIEIRQDVAIEVWMSRKGDTIVLLMRQPIEAEGETVPGLCLINRLVSAGVDA